jgi:hypothetical protein
MTNTDRTVNVEAGKQGFQPTARAEATSASLTVQDIGQPDESPLVSSVYNQHFDEAEGFYARGSYVDFGESGASYGVEVGTGLYEQLLSPSADGEWDDEAVSAIDIAIRSEYDCSVFSNGDGYAINAEFHIPYDSDTDETLATLGNRVENETALLEFMNESQYGNEAAQRVAHHLGWTYEKKDDYDESKGYDPEGYAYFKHIVRDNKMVRVRPDEN